MFRLALLVFVFFLAFWPLSYGHRYIEKRAADFQKISLEAQFELQKRLLSTKDRAVEILGHDSIGKKIELNQLHSIQAELSGQVKHPDTEFLSLVNLENCSVIGKTPGMIPLTEICLLNRDPHYYIQEYADAKNSKYWVLQVFPIKLNKKPMSHFLVFGTNLQLEWLTRNHQKMRKTYSLKLNNSQNNSVAEFDRVDPSIRDIRISSEDWISKANLFLPILTPAIFEGMENLIFVLAILIGGFLIFQYSKLNHQKASQIDNFNQFLRSDLGLNPKQDSHNYIVSWHKLLKDVDLKARQSLKDQKSEIVKLRSKIQKLTIELKKTETDAASMRRFRNIQNHLQLFGQSMHEFDAKHLKNGEFQTTQLTEQTLHNLKSMEDVFGKWDSGIEARGQRRYLRYLVENSSPETPDKSSFDVDYENLKSNYRQIEKKISELQLELGMISKSFSKINTSCQMILEATTSHNSEVLNCSSGHIFKTIQDVAMQNFDHSIELKNQTLANFEISLKRTMIYPLAMSVFQFIQLYSKIVPELSELSIQFKHKAVRQTHYLVILLKSNNKKIHKDFKGQGNYQIDNAIAIIEELLKPVEMNHQILEMSPKQIVLSFLWKEMTDIKSLSLSSMSLSENSKILDSSALT